MQKEMPSPEKLDEIQKENLTDEEIARDKEREGVFNAGKKAGQKEEIKKSEVHEERMKLWEKFRDQWKDDNRQVYSKRDIDKGMQDNFAGDAFTRAAVGLAMEAGLNPEFLRKSYDIRFAHFNPKGLPENKKEVILQILEKIPVSEYEIGYSDHDKERVNKLSDEDIKEIFSKEVLEELVNNHPEFKEVKFNNSAWAWDEEKKNNRIKPIFFELLSDYLGVSESEVRRMINEGNPDGKRSREDMEKGIIYCSNDELVTYFIKNHLKKEE